MFRLASLGGLPAAVLVVALAGCSGGGSSVTPGDGSPSLGSPPQPQQGSASVTAYGVDVLAPTWFPVGDTANLAAALEDYIEDAQRELGGWLPEGASTAGMPLRVILHDTPGLNQYSRNMRTAWLQWPRADSGKPLAQTFLPALHEVLVHDRRRELDVAIDAPWTQPEVDTAMRGRWLPIEMYTFFPEVYE